jgi:hypothetical protein
LQNSVNWYVNCDHRYLGSGSPSRRQLAQTICSYIIGYTCPSSHLLLWYLYLEYMCRYLGESFSAISRQVICVCTRCLGDDDTGVSSLIGTTVLLFDIDAREKWILLTMYWILQVRIIDDSQPSGDYAFAKYNKVYYLWAETRRLGFLLCVSLLQGLMPGADHYAHGSWCFRLWIAFGIRMRSIISGLLIRYVFLRLVFAVKFPLRRTKFVWVCNWRAVVFPGWDIRVGAEKRQIDFLTCVSSSIWDSSSLQTALLLYVLLRS